MGFRDTFGTADGGDPYADVGAGLQWDDRDMARRITMVTNHVRRLRKAPTIAYQMAKLPVPDDQLIQAARSSGMWDEVRRQRTLLTMMPAEKQMRIWAKAGEEQRALLTRSGYQPKTPEDVLLEGAQSDRGGGGGTFGRALDFVPVVGAGKALLEGKPGAAIERTFPGGEVVRTLRGEATEQTAKGVGAGVGADIPYGSDALRNLSGWAGTAKSETMGVIGPGLHALDVAGRAPAHAYRFLREGYERHGDEFFLDPTYWDMKEMSDIWEETGARMGEGYWPEAVHKRVEAIMPHDRRGQILAKRLASGDTIADLAARKYKPDSPAYQEAYLDIAKRAGDPDMQDALRVLELGKVSFGRDLARNFGFAGIHEGDTAYKTFSGGADLWFALYADPLLIGGKVLKAYKAVRAFQLGEVAVGISKVRTLEEGALTTAFAEHPLGWEDAVAKLDPKVIASSGAPTVAFNQRIVNAFRNRNVVDRTQNFTRELAEIVQEVPATKRAMDALRQWDSDLRIENIKVFRETNGRVPTAEEVRALPGISDQKDMWNFWGSTEGRKTFIDGSYGGFTREHISLPRLTRRGLVTGKAKVRMEEAIDFGRFGVRFDVPLADDEVQLVAGARPVKVEEALATPEVMRGDELAREWTRLGGGYSPADEFDIYGARTNKETPGWVWRDKLSPEDETLLKHALASQHLPLSEPPEGSRRLYRVARGTTDLGEPLPEHVNAYQAEQLGMKNWWTDDLSHARTVTRTYGPGGRLFVVDAPEGSFRAVDDVAAIAGREFTITDEAVEASQRHVGAVGDWVVVSEKGRLDRARRWLLAPPSNLIFGMTHRVPESMTLRTFGPNFVPDVERLMDMNFDLPTRRRWMQEMLAVEDTASRRDIASAMLDHLFYANGWYENKVGIEEARKYLLGTRQAYAMDGVDMMPVGGGMMKRVGLLPKADHADGFMIPGYREMRANAQRVGMIARLDGGINNSMVDTFMGTYWKPAVLLRLGFIPRAAGEELLSTMLRIPSVGVDHWILRPLANKEDTPIWLLDRMAGGARYLRHFIGESWGDHVEEFAHLLANRTSGWIRGMAARQLDPGVLDYYRAAARNDYLQTQIARELPAVTGGIWSSELGRESEGMYVYMDPERTQKALMVPGVSDYIRYPKGHPLHNGTLTFNVQRRIEDPAGIAAMEAGGVYFHPSQVKDLDAAIVDSPVAHQAWRDLGNPTNVDVIADVRRVVNSATHDGDFGNALRRYHKLMSSGPDPQNYANAALALEDARGLAANPSERLAVEIFGQVDGSVRDALLVNETQILRRMGATADDAETTLREALSALPPPEEGLHRVYVAAPFHPGRTSPDEMPAANTIAWHDDPDDALFQAIDGRPAEHGFNLYYADFDQDDYMRRLLDEPDEPEDFVTVTPFQEMVQGARLTADEMVLTNLRQVPGFVVPSPFDEGISARAADLVARARGGEIGARDEFQALAVERGIENMRTTPSLSHYVNENERSIRDTTGRTIEYPPAEGRTRLYVLLANENGINQIPLAEAEGVAKQAAAAATPPGTYAAALPDVENYGLSKYQPASTWATQSRTEAEDVRLALSGDNPNDLAVGFIDVKHRDVARIREKGFGDSELPNWRPADEAPIPPGREQPGRVPMPVAEGMPVVWHGARERIPGDELVRFGGASEHNLMGGGLYTSDAEWLSREYQVQGQANPALYHVEWTGSTPPRMLDLEENPPNEILDEIADWLQIRYGRVEGSTLDFEHDWARRAFADALDQSQRPGSFEATAGGWIQRMNSDFNRLPRSERREVMQAFRDEVIGKHYDVMRYDGGLRTGSRPHNAYVWIKETQLKMHGVPGEIHAPLARAYDSYKVAKEEADELYGLVGEGAWIDRGIARTKELQRRYPGNQYETELEQLEQAREEFDRTGTIPSWLDNEFDEELNAAIDRMDEAQTALRENFGYDPDKPADIARLQMLHERQLPADQVADNIKDWSTKVTAATNQLTTSPVDGRYLHEIGSKAARQNNFEIEDLVYSDIPEQHLPLGVMGPQYHVYDPNLWEQVTQKGFDFINRMVAAIAREPLFHHNAAKRYAIARELLAPTLENKEATAGMLALARSVQGAQGNKMTAYYEVWGQMGRANPRLTSGQAITAELEPEMAAVLARIKVDGVKPGLLDEVKRHFKSMSGDELKTVKTYAANQDLINKMTVDSTLSGAVADTIPFIDDHKIRSQFSEFARNILPFHFAEEQMLKRWARVLVHSPEAIRRAQLTYMGLQHSGIIKQNQYGEDVWIIPGSALAQQVLGKGIEAIAGEPYTIPVATPFTGQVKMTLPGFNRVGVPSFSPVLAVPMALLARRFPELNEFNRKILGEQAVGRPITDMLIPLSVKRVYDAAYGWANPEAHYSSAMIQAMQYLEANNLTPEPPGPNATATDRADYRDEMDHYIERVKNWTRVMLIARAGFGFVSPASPALEIQDNLSPELQELLQNVPYEEAIRVFIKRHPDATAYTVFTTKSESGASMPTTPEVGKFLDNNADFVSRHKMATPWLLPQGDADDTTSMSVYANQVKLGLRERKSPREWLEDLAFAEASGTYFDARNAYERHRLNLEQDPERRGRLDDYWNDWKTKYLKMHPLFREQVQSRDAHDRRLRVLEDTRAALVDPIRPEIDHEEELGLMVKAYFAFNSHLEGLSGDRTAAATKKRQRLRVYFANWGQTFIGQHPQLESYWHRNIEPEIGLTAADDLLLEDEGVG